MRVLLLANHRPHRTVISVTVTYEITSPGVSLTSADNATHTVDLGIRRISRSMSPLPPVGKTTRATVVFSPHVKSGSYSTSYYPINVGC